MSYVYMCSFTVMLIAWVSVLLLSAGDNHPNPDPSSSTISVTTSSLSSISSTFINSLNISHHLSFVHYNVQSMAAKLDILLAELFHFDILAFTETWLNSSFSTNYIVYSLLTAQNARTELETVTVVSKYISRRVYVITAGKI